MAAKEEKLQTMHLEHHPKSTHASFDSLTPPVFTPEEEAKVWRKIDMRLIPILALLYLFSILDRGMLYWLAASVWYGSHPLVQETLVRTLPPPSRATAGWLTLSRPGKVAGFDRGARIDWEQV